MSDLEKKYEQAEAAAAKLQAEKDEALEKVYEKYGDRLREANDAAAAAQKEYMDGKIVEKLKDRFDGSLVAGALGLKLPE